MRLHEINRKDIWADNPDDDKELVARNTKKYVTYVKLIAHRLKRIATVHGAESAEWDEYYGKISGQLAAKFGMVLDHTLRHVDNAFHDRTLSATLTGRYEDE